MNNPFANRRKNLNFLSALRTAAQKQSGSGVPAQPTEPSGFTKCPACSKLVFRRHLTDNLYVCPQCSHHFPISARLRLALAVDQGSLRELEQPPVVHDPLGFPGYSEKLKKLQQEHSLADAAVAATGRIGGRPAVLAALDSRFFMGSMGCAVGECITQAVEHAQAHNLPLVIFSASGGARMQEGIFSLMQMAKTSAALARFAQAGGLYIAYLTHPTTGGVSASFAGLGDITLAEPGALIGFAGPRVIQQTLRQKLPEGFQRAEYLEEHGFVDRIVPRSQMRETLSLLLRLHSKGKEAAQ